MRQPLPALNSKVAVLHMQSVNATSPQGFWHHIVCQWSVWAAESKTPEGQYLGVWNQEQCVPGELGRVYPLCSTGLWPPRPHITFMHSTQQAPENEQWSLAVRSNSSGTSTGISKHPVSLPFREQTVFCADAGGRAALVILPLGYLFLLLWFMSR